MRTFYGGLFIEKGKLKEAGINYPVKLEYYKTINGNDYGIEIIKTEYIKENIKIEKKDIKEFTRNEKEANKVLDIFKENEVTPVGAIDVLKDLKFKNIIQTIY